MGSSFQYLHIRQMGLVLIILLISTIALSAPKPRDTSAPGEISDCTRIVEPGTYDVTQDLPASGGLLVSGDCISVETDNVTIILNDHVITGGSIGAAITDGGLSLSNIAIRSGTVTGFEYGLALSNSSDVVIENVRALSNSQDGISIGVRGVLRFNIASMNNQGLVLTCPGNLIGNAAWDNTLNDLFQSEADLCGAQESLNSIGSSAGVSCPAGLTDCSGSCKDLTIDEGNCGECDSACGVGYLCVSGSCELSCQEGLTACSGICTNTLSDPANCGECNSACAAGYLCVAGSCELNCQSGLANCSGTCTDILSDLVNCGGCDNACEEGPHSYPICQDGDCGLICAENYGDCTVDPGCETSLTTTDNCGACGVACGSGQICFDGQCE